MKLANPLITLLAWLTALGSEGARLRAAASQLRTALLMGDAILVESPALSAATVALYQAIETTEIYDEADPVRNQAVRLAMRLAKYDEKLCAVLARLGQQVDEHWEGGDIYDTVKEVLLVFNAEMAARQADAVAVDVPGAAQ